MRASHMRRIIVLLLLLVSLVMGCHRKAADAFTADIVMDAHVPGAPRLTGKLYLGDGHLRADWGNVADVFDLRQRKGWRILLPAAKTYMDLGSKDLSTYAPEMTNGSPCPHAEVPSACKMVGKEKIDGRMANKWDLWNPRGFHVYFWTDEALEVTLRSEIGDAIYEVKNLRGSPVSHAMFELPAGCERLERPWKP